MGLNEILKNREWGFIIDLYLTIWNMCYEDRREILTVAQIHTLNSQDYPDLIPQEMEAIENLEELLLSEYPSLRLFPEILRFKNLRCLELGNNGLKAFPGKLGYLNFLEELWISDPIADLTDEIGSFKELRKLSVSGCKLPSLNENLKRLSKLEVLDLSHNQLETIPDWLSELPELKLLNLYDNSLKEKPVPVLLSEKDGLEIIL